MKGNSRQRPVGICGLLGSGKDTVADIMIKEFPEDFLKYSMAKPMKDIAKVFGFTHEQLYDVKLKEVKDEFWDITPRKFLQFMGTDLFYNQFRKDVWNKMLERQIIGHPGIHLVIPDVRRDDEAEIIRQYGGIIIRVERECDRPAEALQHVTEQGISPQLVTICITNNGTMEELREDVVILAESFLRMN